MATNSCTVTMVLSVATLAQTSSLAIFAGAYGSLPTLTG